MCGIAGIVHFDGRPVVRSDLQRMCAAMAHRGPDDEGFYFKGGVALGMRRLSIIDLNTGHQPVANEDGSVWVVFNGEIYNFRELTRDLKKRGHVFSTSTDTEVIVHLYETYGTDCVQKLRGMFGFALWDGRSRRLLLARDRLGIKPLYYAWTGASLIFASELKAVLQVPAIERRLNWRAVDHLFSFLTTPRDESIVEAVHKLEPAHTLTATPESFAIHRYWDVCLQPRHDRDESYFIQRLREVLHESVRLHMVSDVPVGAFLSGGIDSSTVVALMARLNARPIKTFSIGFTEREYNELDDARRVSQALGTEHQELILEPDVLEIIDDLAWYLDEPFGDSSAIPTYMVSRMASRDLKVVLSGDGGDELFAGYDKYLVELRERRIRRFLPSPLQRIMKAIGEVLPEGFRGRNSLVHFSLPDLHRYVDANTLYRTAQKKRLFQEDVYEHLRDQNGWTAELEELARKGGHWLSTLQYVDLHRYLPLDILSKVDRMSMANSLEARVPLLDHKVVEFAATIPPELQLKQEETKYILKRAMEGIIPAETIHKKKQGFAVPLKHWFRGQLGGFVRQLLLSPNGKRREIFNPAYIERLLIRHESGRNLDLHLWTLISFELWCRTFLDGRGHHLRDFPGAADPQKQWNSVST